MNEELKPCPFCQQLPYVEPWFNSYDDEVVDSCDVHCSNCGIQGSGKTEEEAIKAWNKRIDAKTQPRSQEL